MEESYQVKQQTINGIDSPRLQREEESGKPDSNLKESLILEKYVDSSHQGERFSGTNSNLTEDSRYVRTQKMYSNDAPSILPEKGAGKPNRDLNKVLTLKRDIESNYQAREVHEIGRISGVNSTLMEEPHQVKLQTSDGINILSMQQKEEPRKPNNITITSPTSETGVVSSHQGERISGSDSTLTEESHHVNNPSMRQNEVSGKPHNNTKKTSHPEKML